MSIPRQIARGFRVLFRRERADRDLGDEVQHLFDETVAAHEARGLSSEQARREARLAFGSPVAIREHVRDHGWERAVRTSLNDLRYAVRQFRHRPGFAVVSIVTLALGIGAATSIFSAVNPVLFQPLPYADAGRILTIWDGGANGRLAVTFGTFREVAARQRSFEALAVLRPWQPALTGMLPPERLSGQRVSADYFRVLGVSPAIGRHFSQDDDRPAGPDVAIVSDRLWRRRLDRDPSIVGRQVTLDDKPVLIIGVMPAGFENVLAPAAELWAPLQYDPSLPLDGREWGHHLALVGRLAPAATLDRAWRELDAIAAAPDPSFSRPPWAALSSGFTAAPLQDDIVRGVKPALAAVMGAVLLLVAIACVNVTSLLLARGGERQAELAMRAALGAGRSRLARQLMTESLLLAACGGAVGLGVAVFGVRAIVALSPPGLPRLDAIRLDTGAFGFAVAATTIVGVIVGLMPAWSCARRAVLQGVSRASLRTAGGHHRARRGLVVAEIALALVLLVGAGLLVRSLQTLFAASPGFQSSHRLTMVVQASGIARDAGAVHQRFGDALEAVRHLPGVRSAAWTSQMPLSGDADVYGVHFNLLEADRRRDEAAYRYGVSPGYFETMGIALKEGRYLDERDAAGAPLAVVLSDSFARRVFPSSAIGQRMRIGPADGPVYTVVGIVDDVKQASLALAANDAVYTTNAQWQFLDTARWLVVDAVGDAGSLAPSVREALWSVDANQPILRTTTLDDVLLTSEADRRFTLVVFLVFGAAAFGLAAVGIYGMVSGGVTERLREIGVRTALGASRHRILLMVVGQGVGLAVPGVMCGVVGALLARDALESLLFGISPVDPATYVVVSASVLALSCAASAIPAWRASRVDPSVTLRA